MNVFGRWTGIALILCATTTWAQSGERAPHAAYLFPAGGQQGASFEVTLGGQFLNGVTDAYVSGTGVHATVIQYARPLNNMQLNELRRQLGETMRKRQIEETGKMLGVTMNSNEASGGIQRSEEKAEPEKPEVELPPDHPLIKRLDAMNPPELKQFIAQFTLTNQKQVNSQLAEMTILQISIDPDAAPGDRELRLVTPSGLTNPMCFQVSQMPEIYEQEPNDLAALTTQVLDLPVVLNGQIMAGDVDRFRIRVQHGQQIVAQVLARHLVPFLADGVPGWFQATLALYDAKTKKEIAFADDYRFDPDPVLTYKIPNDGEYEIEIHDALYRGREDFVYRIYVGEQPFITRMTPLGGREGIKTVTTVSGWNLPDTLLPLDMQAGGGTIRQAALLQNGWVTNPLTYAVDALPECTEQEPNETRKNAQTLVLPQIVNGCIAQPGDVDLYQFEGKAGEQIVAEIMARRLNTPLDSLLRLTNASGKVLAWNDDYEGTNIGLIVQRTDSCLTTTLPQNGTYYVEVSDTQRQGGDVYNYRLRVAPPQPDFELYVTPSGLGIPAGRAMIFCAHVIRKEGFKGAVTVALKDAPAGFVLNGGRISGDCDRLRLTLTAPLKPASAPVIIQLEGRADLNGKTIAHVAVPADEMMQAFLYQHLVQTKSLMVKITGGKRRAPLAEWASNDTVRIPVAGKVEVIIRAPQNPKLSEVQLALNDPPKGISLQDLKVVPEGLSFSLKAEADMPKVGFADNLIVEAFLENTAETPNAKPGKQNRRISLGVLPALPIEMVKP